MKQYELIKKHESYEFDYIDQNGVSHNSPAWWLWSILGGCGCGNSDQLAEKAVKLLKHFASDHNKREWDIYKDEEAEVIAHWMYSKELIDHGGSIGDSWLSETGELIFKSISKYE